MSNLFKSSNKDTRTPEQRFRNRPDVFINIFEQISHIFSAPIVYFELVSVVCVACAFILVFLKGMRCKNLSFVRLRIFSPII